MTYSQAYQKIKEALAKKGYNITPHDKYFDIDDGYYDINVIEIPKWRFGIWFDELDENKEYLEGCFFCQYEDTISKFKPSWSSYCFKIIVSEEKAFNEYANVEILSLLDFIKKHPLRAWYRDYTSTDYNITHVSGFKMLFKFIAYKYKDFAEDFLQKIFDDYMLQRTADLWNSEVFDEALVHGWTLHMHDAGENIYPRYEMQIEMPIVTELQGTGCYGLSEENQYLWDKTCDKLEKLARKFGVYYSTKVSDSAIFWNKKDFEDYWNGELWETREELNEEKTI